MFTDQIRHFGHKMNQVTDRIEFYHMAGFGQQEIGLNPVRRTLNVRLVELRLVAGARSAAGVVSVFCEGAGALASVIRV